MGVQISDSDSYTGGHASPDVDRLTAKREAAPFADTDPYIPDADGADFSFDRVDVPRDRPADIHLGQYRLLEQIGRGGMGIVYRALHTRLKKQFAVKVLSRGRMGDPKAVARFHREMEAVGRLDHANIVRATDAGEVGGVHFLAMELIEGIDLAKLLRACGALRVADACELVRQTAAGLQAAHERSLVHRDIKPSNLVLSREGQLKILDLGLARLTEPQAAAPHELSWTGQVLGTPDYMAPEQWESVGTADIRSDLYSLGCTLYALLTGRPPFGTEEYNSNTKKMAGHLRDTAVPVSTERPELPKAVAGIVDRLMAKDPAKRYQTPAALGLDLAKFAAGADLKALVERGLLIAQRDIDETLTRPVPAPSSRGRRRGFAALGAGVALLAGVCLGLFFWPDPRRDEVTVTKPTAPAAEAKRIPGVWYDLLEREPTALVWPEAPANPRRVYEPMTKTVFVDSPAFAMISFGDTEAANFELELSVLQNPWSGNFGIFFYGSWDGKLGTAQSLALDRFLPQHDNDQISLVRTLLRIANPRSPAQDRLSAVKLNYPTAGKHTLSIAVRDRKLASAAWDGTTVSDARFLDSVGGPDPTGRGTGLGVYVDMTSATFSSVRFRIPKPEDLARE